MRRLKRVIHLILSKFLLFKKALDIINIMTYRDLRQAFQKEPAVPAGHNPNVQNREDTPIEIVSYQSSQALFKGYDC